MREVQGTELRPCCACILVSAADIHALRCSPQSTGVGDKAKFTFERGLAAMHTNVDT